MTRALGSRDLQLLRNTFGFGKAGEFWDGLIQMKGACPASMKVKLRAAAAVSVGEEKVIKNELKFGWLTA